MNPAIWGRALRWPLWSWRNLTITAAVVLAVMATLGRLTASPRASTAAATTATAATATASPTVPATATPTTPASPSSAPGAAPTPPSDVHSPVASAAAFAAAWARTTLSGPAWLAGLKPWATASLLSSLDGTDPRQVPATRVTGDAALVRTTATSATVSVPTDGGRISVTLVRTGGTWKANALAPDDAPPDAPTPSLVPGQSATGN